MEQTVTMQKVQEAITQLRNNKERISRRNVLAITGGGMSTVHRLMSQLEDTEALKAAAPAAGISAALQSAILAEIGSNVLASTAACQEQNRLLQNREAEALDALAEVETRAERLAAELINCKSQADQNRHSAEKDYAVASEHIKRLEKTVTELQEERRQLFEAAETARIDTAKILIQIESAEKTAEKAEAKFDQLSASLQKAQKQLAETEKRAAVAGQKVSDLREALAKAENRSGMLEEKMEGYTRT